MFISFIEIRLRKTRETELKGGGREKRDSALTVVCLEGLGFDHLTALAAHDQVKVVLCRTLPKNGHICMRKREKG